MDWRGLNVHFCGADNWACVGLICLLQIYLKLCTFFVGKTKSFLYVTIPSLGCPKKVLKQLKDALSSHLSLIVILLLLCLQNALTGVDYHHLEGVAKKVILRLKKDVERVGGWPEKQVVKKQMQKSITGKSSSRTSMEPLRQRLRE